MNHKRTWIYCRVAHSGPDTAKLLESQHFRLERYAKEQGFEIIGSSSDIGSGLIFDRPGLRDFLGAVDDDAVDVLLLPNLSRLGRDTNKVLWYWKMLHGRGIDIYTIMEGKIDLSVHAMLREILEKQKTPQERV